MEIDKSIYLPKAPPLDFSKISTSTPAKTRYLSLESAPIYTPTIAEFKDPLKYIASIREQAQEFGIIKIIPPSNWKPTFSIDTQTFWFKTRLQRLSSMEGSSRMAQNYLEKLQLFHQQQGIPFNHLPTIDKKPLDLLNLRNQVMAKGGYSKVNRDKKWAEIGRCMGYSGRSTSWLSSALRSNYSKFIHPYEEYLISNTHETCTKNISDPIVMQVKSEISPEISPEKSSPEKSPEKSSEKRSNPRRRTHTTDSTGTHDSFQDVATNISHSSQTKNVRSSKYVPPKILLKKIGQDACEVCLQEGNEEKMLLCDGCNRGFHIFCLQPPLTDIPDCDWHCVDCIKGTGDDFGFEDGEERCLYQFQHIAEKFKQDYFATRFEKEKGKLNITEADTEREFWSLVESPFDDVEVEYGADLHSSLHGSGFPVVEKDPLNPYSTCAWNLNNIPVLKDSLFRNIKKDISGMMVPWLYVGMIFSTFCWHTEDHSTYSINYNHWGETKTWYGVPASNADKFEEAMQETVPELFESNPDLLFHLTTMLSPKVLTKKGVKVFSLDQRAGEFVVTFPRSYHSGFNHGFNFAEAVNFALPDWLSFGYESVDRYHLYKKIPVFSHDELVIATLKKEFSVDAAYWIKMEFEKVMKRTKTVRKNFLDSYPPDKVRVVYLDAKDEICRQCVECHSFCYLTSFYCQCAPLKIACDEHINMICECEFKQIVMQIRLDDDQLSVLERHVNKVASQPSAWKQRLLKLAKVYKRPPLKELTRLFVDSENLSELDPEVADLKVFLDEAYSWLESASRVFSKKKSKKHSLPLAATTPVTQLFGPEKTLKNIKSLLVKVYDMQFDAQEIHQMEELVNRATSFQNEARQLMSTENASIEELKDMKEKGLKIEIGMEELLSLDQRIAKCQWEIDAKSVIDQKSCDVKLCYDFIRTSADYEISPDNPVILALIDMKNQAEAWREEASSLLKSKEIRPVTLDYIEDLLARSASIPYFKPIVVQVEKVHSVVKEWYGRAADVFSKDSIGRFTLTEESLQPYSTVKKLVDEARALPVSIQMPNITDAVKATEIWLTKGKRALGKANSARNFGMMLSDLIVNVEACTTHVHNDDVYCVCHKQATDSSVMIECDDCHQWYHLACVKVSKKVSKMATSYKCPICKVSFENVRAGHKIPILFQLKAFLKEGLQLLLVPSECQILEQIINMASDFQIKIKDFLAQTGELDVKSLKNFLRSAEGMDIILEPDLRHLRKKVLSLNSPPPTVNVPAQLEFCICKSKTVNDKSTVACAKCDSLFHIDCIGLSNDSVLDYICKKCQVKDAPKSLPLSTSKSKIIIRLSGSTENSPTMVTAILPPKVVAPPPELKAISNDSDSDSPAVRPRRAAVKPPAFYSLNSTHAATATEIVAPVTKKNIDPPPKKKQKLTAPKIVTPSVKTQNPALSQEQLMFMQQYEQQDADIYVQEGDEECMLPPPPPSWMPTEQPINTGVYPFSPGQYNNQDYYFQPSPFAVFPNDPSRGSDVNDPFIDPNSQLDQNNLNKNISSYYTGGAPFY